MATIYPIGVITVNVNVVITNTVMTATATAAVILRIWSRNLTKVGLGLDDYLITFSLFTLYVLYIIDILDIVYGMRRHVTEIGLDNLQILLKMLIPYQVMYGTTMAAIKFSYLTFFRQIFRVRDDFSKYAYILMVAVGVWWIGNNLQIFLMCRPFNLNWNPLLPGTCGNRPLSFVLVAVFNIVTDVGILLLPIPYIGSLQMPSKKKFILILMFSLGLFITSISAVRLSAMSQLNFNDISWDMLESAFWTVIEPCVAITNAGLPVLRPALQILLPSVFPSMTEQRNNPSDLPTIGSHSRRPAQRIYDDDEITLTRVDKDATSTRSHPCSASS